MVDEKSIKDIKEDYKSIWRNKTLDKLSNFEYNDGGVYKDFEEGLPVYSDEEWGKVFTAWFNCQLNDKLKVERPLAVLDIGSHTGKWTTFIGSIAEKVICADVYKESEDIIRMRFENILKSHNKELEFKLINGKNLDVFDDESIGLVWSVDSFTRLNTHEITTYIEDIIRVLKPGGLALLHIPRHDKVQQSGVMGVPFPKFDIFLMSKLLPEKTWKDLRIRIEYSNAYTIEQVVGSGPYFKPYKNSNGHEVITNIMIHQYGGPGVIELPGLGQFMMIEKPKIK